MIDFHSHILAGVDDGSRSYDETVKILEEAKEVGFDKIISTSHFAIDCYEVPEYKRKEIIDQLNLENRFPEIILGSEIFLTYNILDLLNEFKASTINGTNYILLELPLRNHFMNLRDLIIKLKENDYRLILAHPERYGMVQKDFNILYELKEMGVLLQANYGSILGLYGGTAKRILKKMLKEDLVDFFGSDVHRENTIYPRIPKAIQKISKYISDDRLEGLINYNAEKILNGEDV